MLTQNTPTQSAFEQLRDFPMDKAARLWSEGKTIREYPAEDEAPLPPWQNETYRKAHMRHCAADAGQCWLDKAELEHLLKTSEYVPWHDEGIENYAVPTRERTIDQELRAAGFSTLLLDKPFESETGQSEIDLADRHLGRTPYERPTPLTIKRIEWERRTKLSGAPVRTRIRERQDGSAEVQIAGAKLTDDQRRDMAKAYIKRLLAERGRLPTLDEIRAWHRKCEALPTLEKQVPYASEDFRLSFYTDMDDDPHRDRFHVEDTPLIERPDGQQPGTQIDLGVDGTGIVRVDDDTLEYHVTPTSNWDLGRDLTDPYAAMDDVFVI